MSKLIKMKTITRGVIVTAWSRVDASNNNIPVVVTSPASLVLLFNLGNVTTLYTDLTELERGDDVIELINSVNVLSAGTDVIELRVTGAYDQDVVPEFLDYIKDKVPPTVKLFITFTNRSNITQNAVENSLGGKKVYAFWSSMYNNELMCVVTPPEKPKTTHVVTVAVNESALITGNANTVIFNGEEITFSPRELELLAKNNPDGYMVGFKAPIGEVIAVVFSNVFNLVAGVRKCINETKGVKIFLLGQPHNVNTLKEVAGPLVDAVIIEGKQYNLKNEISTNVMIKGNVINKGCPEICRQTLGINFVFGVQYEKTAFRNDRPQTLTFSCGLVPPVAVLTELIKTTMIGILNNKLHLIFNGSPDVHIIATACKAVRQSFNSRKVEIIVFFPDLQLPYEDYCQIVDSYGQFSETISAGNLQTDNDLVVLHSTLTLDFEPMDTSTGPGADMGLVINSTLIN